MKWIIVAKDRWMQQDTGQVSMHTAAYFSTMGLWFPFSTRRNRATEFTNWDEAWLITTLLLHQFGCYQYNIEAVQEGETL